MYTKIGFVSYVIAFFIALFKGIASFMEKKNMFSEFYISDILGDFSDKFISFFYFGFLKNAVEYIVYDVELYINLLAFGTIFFIIGGLKKD